MWCQPHANTIAQTIIPLESPSLTCIPGVDLWRFHQLGGIVLLTSLLLYYMTIPTTIDTRRI